MVVSEGVVVALKGGAGGPKYCRLPPGSQTIAAPGSPWHAPAPGTVPPIEQLLWMMGMRSFWSETVFVEAPAPQGEVLAPADPDASPDAPLPAPD